MRLNHRLASSIGCSMDRGAAIAAPHRVSCSRISTEPVGMIVVFLREMIGRMDYCIRPPG